MSKYEMHSSYLDCIFSLEIHFTNKLVCNPLICHKPAEFMCRRIPQFAAPPWAFDVDTGQGQDSSLWNLDPTHCISYLHQLLDVCDLICCVTYKCDSFSFHPLPTSKLCAWNLRFPQILNYLEQLMSVSCPKYINNY